MARLITAGFEWHHQSAEATPTAAGVASRTSASAARTGTYGLRLNNTLGAWLIPGTPATGRTYFMRGYFRTSAAPAALVGIMSIGQTGSAGVYARLNTDLTLRLTTNDGTTFTDVGSPSAALSINTWYRIEVSAQFNGGAADDLAELLIDGISVASTSTATVSTAAPARVYFGHQPAGVSWNCDFDYDDVALNDATGASQTSWPGSGKVALCLPISDSQVGSWTGGAGGVTNLFAAVDNVPPTGTAAETDSTQIESIDGSGDNATDEYRASLTTYTNAGIGASDTITLIQAVLVHGEDVATNTKTGSVGLQSNPSQTYATFTFGDDAGALGTFDTGWKVKNGDPVYAPSVTLGSSPVLALRKTDTGTRVASACAMGLYIDYIPSTGAPSLVFNPQPLQHLRLR